MVNGSVGIHLIGQGRGASDLQNLIICKVEMKVTGSMYIRMTVQCWKNPWNWAM